jgi:steroid delta-isomerase-like uncharacterized protein
MLGVRYEVPTGKRRWWTLTKSENERIVHEINEALNNHDFDSALSYCADDMVYVGPSRTRHNKQETREVMIRFNKAFRNTIRIDRMISTDNNVVGEATWTLTHKGEYFGIPATHKTVELETIGIMDLEAGKVKLWKIYANMRRLEQALRKQ